MLMTPTPGSSDPNSSVNRAIALRDKIRDEVEAAAHGFPGFNLASAMVALCDTDPDGFDLVERVIDNARSLRLVTSR